MVGIAYLGPKMSVKHGLHKSGRSDVCHSEDYSRQAMSVHRLAEAPGNSAESATNIPPYALPAHKSSLVRMRTLQDDALTGACKHGTNAQAASAVELLCG